MSRRVWITRTAPAGLATASRVRALGFEPLVAPLLVTRAVGAGPIDLTDIRALAFTSANGVEAFARRTVDRALPVYVVGAATAAAARTAGFACVRSADGDVNALSRLISEHAAEIAGAVLHPAAAERAAELSPSGAPVRVITVYETAEAALPEAITAAIPDLHAILVYSGKAARILAAYLRGRPAPGVRLLCLSPDVAAPLIEGGAREISVAALPNEEALLNLLVD